MTKLRTCFTLAVLLCVNGIQPLGAQQLAKSLWPDPIPPLPASLPTPAQQPTETADMAFAGIALGAVGALVGWHAGGRTTRSTPGALIGAALGESILLPYGVHRANGSRGDYAASAFSSLAVGGVGLLAVLARMTDDSLAAAAIVVPAVQLVVSIHVERGSSR